MRFNRKNSYYFWGNVTIRCRNEKIAGEIPVISLGWTKIQILTVEIPFVMWGVFQRAGLDSACCLSISRFKRQFDELIRAIASDMRF
ncbi:hypothetical protein J2T15_000402 [Paenibacillus harenae]|uniref:Uncharacterized protein n=1 Tax=Paenibacillus harenae TaxID=306543 RepID=A0ABT9TUF2_PAEHA|nr:hypothetical protein [Paenibacillus harenae]